MPALATHRGNQIIARSLRIAGLDAVDALHLPQQGIVIADRHAAILEAGKGEIAVILGEALLDGAAEQRLLARGGDLGIGRQTRSVDVDRVGHAERLRPVRHQRGELSLAAGDRLGDDDRRVVGRAGHDALDGVLDADHVVGLEAELGRRLRRRMSGNRKARIEAELFVRQLLEQQIKRHDFRQ